MSQQPNKLLHLHAKNEINGIVWYELLIKGQKLDALDVIVKPGDTIDSIKKRIIAQNSRLLNEDTPIEIETFTSVPTQKPLCPTIEWNPTVPWGTSETPLIVKVHHPIQPVTKCMQYIILGIIRLKLFLSTFSPPPFQS
jgi:hypothetical protein